MRLDDGVVDYSSRGKRRNFVHSLATSQASAAIFIFITVFLVCTRAVTNRPRVDALIRNITVDRWCHRFEKYVVSSSRPDIVIVGSSTALVPSEMCDVAFHVGPVLPDLVALQTYSEHYEAPVFFLQCLSNQGFAKVSALNLSIPTADIQDENLLIEDMVAFGKKPKLVILAIGPRDYVVWPSQDLPLNGSPIVRCLRDLKPPAREFIQTRIIPWFLVYMRPSALARLWDDEKYYFSYEMAQLVRPARLALEKIWPQVSQLPDYKESSDKFCAEEVWSVPNKTRIDLLPMKILLSCYRPDFLNEQIAALEKTAKLLQSNGIKMLVVETQLCPGTEIPAKVNEAYYRQTEAICRRYGAQWYRPGRDRKFDPSDFSDAMHMNAFGGYKWYTSTAKYIADHRSELLE